MSRRLSSTCLVWLLLSVGAGSLHAQRAGFVYHTNTPPGSPNTIRGYSINGQTGALDPLPGSPFADGGVIVDPTGRFVYAPRPTGNYTRSEVMAYTIDAETGSQTPVPGAPFPAGDGAAWLVVEPLGEYAYVVNQQSQNISAYSIDGMSGALTQIPGSPFPTGGYYPHLIAAEPSGNFIYVLYRAPRGTSDIISAYRIDRATGALAEIPGSPFRIPRIAPAGQAPVWVTAEPNGKFIYVVDQWQKVVWAYTIDATTGALAVTSESPFAVPQTEGFPGVLAIESTGQFAYLATNAYPNRNILEYSIDQATGALSPIGQSPFRFEGVVHLAVDPTGQFLYAPVTAQDSSCSQTTPCASKVVAYVIDQSTGTLSEIPESPFPAGDNAGMLTTTAGPQPPPAP